MHKVRIISNNLRCLVKLMLVNPSSRRLRTNVLCTWEEEEERIPLRLLRYIHLGFKIIVRNLFCISCVGRHSQPPSVSAFGLVFLQYASQMMNKGRIFLGIYIVDISKEAFDYSSPSRRI